MFTMEVVEGSAYAGKVSRGAHSVQCARGDVGTGALLVN